MKLLLIVLNFASLKGVYLIFCFFFSLPARDCVELSLFVF